MFVTAQQLEQQMPDASRLLSHEPEIESSLRYMQLLLLVTCLEWLWRDQNDFFMSHQWKPTFAEQVEQERQRAERLAEYLRNQGIDPDNLP